MSKLSFRARALDATKPLPVYHAEDVPDLQDLSAINRTVPQMPTGMEKEEESELHLQEVITAQQTNHRHQIYIPTPEATITAPHYNTLYKSAYDKPSQYIRVPGLGLDEEVPDYDLDVQDEEWLSAQSKERPLSPTHFERMMDRLEKGSGNTVLSEQDAQLLLKDDEDLVVAVYDYWLGKRLRLGRTLNPTVRHERRDGTASGSNPYLAFRKRTEKMQTRKNRKNDEMAYCQMLKLKRDLAKACKLADYIKQREDRKQEMCSIQLEVFRKRYMLEDWSGSILSSLRPVATRSASSRQASVIAEGRWEGRSVYISMDGDGDDVHRVGRHEVLVPSSLRKKSKKKSSKFYFPPVVTPDSEPVVSSPDKVVKDTQKDLAEKSDDEEVDGYFAFKRKPHVRYYKARTVRSTWPWYEVGSEGEEEEEEEEEDREEEVEREGRRKRMRHYRFSRASLSGRVVGRARRRAGRGGRCVWDRTMLGSDEEADVDMDSSPQDAASGAHSGLHFVSRSPSPSLAFEPQRLRHLDVPASTQYHSHPVSGSLTFGGFSSDSEYQDEALSFSSLPTSQFALKPSSAAVDPDPAQEHEPAGLGGWSGVLGPAPSPDTAAPTVWGAAPGDVRSSGAVLPPPRGPDATPAPSSTSDPRCATPPVPGPLQPPGPAGTRDLSRSSLSVADSRTIVLSNSASKLLVHRPGPAPGPAPSPTPGPGPLRAVPHTEKEKQPGTADRQSAGITKATDRERLPPNGPLLTAPSSEYGTSKSLSVLSMNGPSSGVLLLNSLPCAPRGPVLGAGPAAGPAATASRDTAALVTSQLAHEHQPSTAFELKREGGVALPLPVVATAAPPPNTASSVALPLKPLPLQQQALAISQAASKVESLTAIVDSKRVAGLQAVARRASTNGSSYPAELFHTARRLSETERGLKQALTGSVMNHTSGLIEASANSLVSLANSSEVT